MASIRATMVIDKTVANLNAATIDAVLQWIKTNVTDKLPSDTSLNVTLTIIP